MIKLFQQQDAEYAEINDAALATGNQDDLTVVLSEDGEIRPNGTSSNDADVVP